MTQNLAYTVAFGYLDNPDVWCEFSVTWSSPDDDQVVSFLTPDDDHYVVLMAGANAGPLWTGGCDTNDVSDVVSNGSPHRFRSRPIGDCLSLVSLTKNGSRSRPMIHGCSGTIPPGCERM